MQQLSLFDFGDETPKPEKKKKATKKGEDSIQDASQVESSTEGPSPLLTPDTDQAPSLPDNRSANDTASAEESVAGAEASLKKSDKPVTIQEDNAPVLVPPEHILEDDNQEMNETPVQTPTSAPDEPSEPVSDQVIRQSDAAKSSQSDQVNENAQSNGATTIPRPVPPDTTIPLEKAEGEAIPVDDAQDGNMENNANTLPAGVERGDQNAAGSTEEYNNESVANNNSTFKEPEKSPIAIQDPPSQATTLPPSNQGSQANQDVVFSNEKIVVKFKPKTPAATAIDESASGETVKPNAEQEAESQQNTENVAGEIREQVQQAPAEQINEEAMDTSFPPVEEHVENKVNQPSGEFTADTGNNGSTQEVKNDSPLSPPVTEPTEAINEEKEPENPEKDPEGINKLTAATADDVNEDTEEDLQAPAPANSTTDNNAQNASSSTTNEIDKDDSHNISGDEQKNHAVTLQQETSNKSTISSENTPSAATEDLGDRDEKNINQGTLSVPSGNPVIPGNIYAAEKEENIQELDLSNDDNQGNAIQSEDNLKKVRFEEEKSPITHKRGRKSFKEIDAEVDLIDVPSDEELFSKQYYPISVVAKWFRVNNSLLRFWENEFKILKPKKNKKGDRFFRPEDVKNLQVIYYLLRQKKLTISGAIKHLKANKEHTEVNLQLIKSLNDFKGFLLELRATTEK